MKKNSFDMKKMTLTGMMVGAAVGMMAGGAVKTKKRKMTKTAKKALSAVGEVMQSVSSIMH
ncbi:MAG: hypothetical protein IJ002_04265 [Clostridia bacterium]|nr:hypothetical protein [Clostridia bacterium]